MLPSGHLNNWANVQDFKWLKREASPNWSTLAEHTRFSSQMIKSNTFIKGDYLSTIKKSVDEALNPSVASAAVEATTGGNDAGNGGDDDSDDEI